MIGGRPLMIVRRTFHDDDAVRAIGALPFVLGVVAHEPWRVEIPSTWGAKISGEQFKERVGRLAR